MGEAAARVRTGEVTQAVRDSAAECGPIAAGDWIAITRDGIRRDRRRRRSTPRSRAARPLVDDDRRARHGARRRRRATPRTRDRLAEHVALAHPHVEIEVHEGGQPLYPYLIGVE